MESTLYSVSDIVRLTGRKTVTIHQWIRHGQLKAQKIGTSYVVRHEDYLTFVEDREKRGFTLEAGAHGTRTEDVYSA